MAAAQIEIIFHAGESGVNTLTLTLNGVEVDFVTSGGAASNSLALYDLINDSYSDWYSVTRIGPTSGNYRIFITALEDSAFYNFNSELVRNDGSFTISVLEESFSEEEPECTLIIGSVTPTNETGEGLNDGTVDSSISGQFGSAYYSLDGVDYVEESEFTGLEPGDYIYYVRDENDCVVSQPFTIEAFDVPYPQTPTECFNPTLVISELNPYRFVLKHCNPSDDIDKLYNEREICGVYQPCYFQPVLCDDLFTLQIQYTEEEFGSPSITYNTIPRLRIIDHFTQEILYTLSFTDLGSGIYKIEKNLDELPNICEKRVYLEIISYSSFFDDEYYTHARSEGIHFSNYHECTTLIEYWNDSDYNDTYYEETGYINNLRIEGIFDEEDLPQESEVYVKSNGQRVLLSETITEVWNLEVGHSPFYLHKIIALALSHDHVRINGREYVKEEPYSFERIKDYSLRKGLGKLTAKTYQSKNLIY